MQATKKMIRAYQETTLSVAMFFSGMFRADPQNFHNSEEVEIDIQRVGSEVSIAIQDLSTGYRANSAGGFDTKAFKPPVHKESFPISSFKLVKKQFGLNQYADPSARANLIAEFFKGMRRVEGMVRRAIEQQAAQVLQTGGIKLMNEKGEEVYKLDFGARESHFPTVGTDWDTPASDKLKDIDTVAARIRTNGLVNPDDIYFGSNAWANFINDEKVLKLLDNRNLNMGQLNAGESRGAGATFHGTIMIGAYRYNLYTYDAMYTDAETEEPTPYLDADNVVIRASNGRLDATFGDVPNIGLLLGAQPTKILDELPQRFSDKDSGVDLITNTWLTPDGETLHGGVASRPLMVPTAIDTFGCIKTKA